RMPRRVSVPQGSLESRSNSLCWRTDTKVQLTALLRDQLQGDVEALDGSKQIGPINEIGFPALGATGGEMRHRPGKTLGGCRSAMRTGDRNRLSIGHRERLFSRFSLIHRREWIAYSTRPVPPPYMLYFFREAKNKFRVASTRRDVRMTTRYA